MVLRKPSSGNSTIEIKKSVFLMVSVVSLETEVILESKETKYCSSLPFILRVSSELSGIINGLAVKLCGAIGVITKQLEVGIITGPPQLKEYPVEPVGVEIIKPSAQ